MPDIATTIEKVRSFSNLDAGWHFGEGVAPVRGLQERAIALLELANRLSVSRANAFPGADGEVQVTFYHENKVLELTFEIDGNITIAKDEGNHQVFFLENANVEDAFFALKEFSREIWDISESFTVSTMISSAATSLVSHSGNLAMAVSQFLTSLAQWREAARRVVTSQPSTPVKPVIRRSIGKSQTTSSPRIAGMSKAEAPLATIAIMTSTIGARAEREKLVRH